MKATKSWSVEAFTGFLDESEYDIRHIFGTLKQATKWFNTLKASSKAYHRVILYWPDGSIYLAYMSDKYLQI